MPTQIPLPCGRSVLVDDEDAERLSGYPWRLSQYGYAIRTKDSSDPPPAPETISMHREICNAPDGVEVDHRNMDRLDNRRENMRLCTRCENQQNRVASGETSDYKGVCWDATHEKWIVRIQSDGKRRHLGRFHSEVRAAMVYNEAAKKLHGSYARLNEI